MDYCGTQLHTVAHASKGIPACCNDSTRQAAKAVDRMVDFDFEIHHTIHCKQLTRARLGKSSVVDTFSRKWRVVFHPMHHMIHNHCGTQLHTIALLASPLAPKTFTRTRALMVEPDYQMMAKIEPSPSSGSRPQPSRLRN